MRKTIAIAAFLSLGVSLSATAGEVTGTVYDQRGIPAAGVLLSVEGQETVTAQDGTYRFADVAAGDRQIVANGQRVSVQVAEVGEASRNIFLMSRQARADVTGASVDAEAAEAAFAEALELAEHMLGEGEARGEIAWRWNDHEG